MLTMSETMRLFVVLLIVFVLIVTGNDTKNSTTRRLSGNVIPSNYHLDLTLREDFGTTHNFRGVVTIHLTVTNDTGSFQIHAKDLDIVENRVTLHKDSGECQTIKFSKADPESDLRTISNRQAGNFPAGDYTLTMKYTGKLSETLMVGFFLSSYMEGGEKKYLAATHFEAMEARRAFPCFDEPALKSSFDISITHPARYSAHSNGAAKGPPEKQRKYKKTSFEKTPPMSTYLVAFVVSEFECTSGKDIANGVPNIVCARPGLSTTTTTAAETAVNVLKNMETYSGVPYKDMKMNKLTQFAIPDFAAEAMENWGLALYSEASLLYDEVESSNAYLQVTTSLVAHELSHQWFGNLVSLNWWSDIFLKEGFAVYFQYHIVDLFRQNWDLPKQFVIERLQTVLLTDSSDDAMALHVESDDPVTIANRFDDISYNKGGSVFRMVSYFLALDNFQKGLKDYVKKNKNQSTQRQDLWAALNIYAEGLLPGGTDLSKIMQNWTEKPGYPLLTVSLDENKIATISQERFLLNGTGDTTWYVPISYTLSNGTNDFSTTTTKEWLIPGQTLSINIGDEWIVLNNQQTGYYRVNYDETLLNKISDALINKIDDIDEISRAQIVDDQLNLARANKKKYSEVLEFLKFLKNDTSYYSWSAALNSFSYFFQRMSDSAVRKALTSYLNETMESLLKSVPFATENRTNQIYTLKYVLANTWSCNLGNEECITAATEEVSDLENVSANRKSIVYCYGLRHHKNQSEGFDALWKKYKETQLGTEQVTILNALGCTNDTKLQETYLKKTLTDDIRRQDAPYAFSSVFSNGPEGVTTTLNFIKDYHDDFNTRFGRGIFYTMDLVVSGVADRITTSDQLDLLKELNSTVQTDFLFSTVESNLKTTKELESAFKEYFGHGLN